MTEPPQSSAPTEAGRCTSCAELLADGATFCEACGTPTDPNTVLNEVLADDQSMPPTVPAPVDQHRTRRPAPAENLARCEACGGSVNDGYCTVCGVRARTVRDHWTEQPSPFVAGMCDRGVVHLRNEDAMALAALPDGSLAVMVVCDGVTSAPDSDKASLASARAACNLLIGTATPPDGEAAIVAGWEAALRRTAQAANASVVGIARTLGDPPEPPSCTFVAAVIDRGLVVVGWCGDSRALWIPDSGHAAALTVDHSLGTEMINAGMTQAEAEADPRFHTITRWLGADSVDATIDVASRHLDEPGWVVVASDGLWNYASTPTALAAALERVRGDGAVTDPAVIAAGLVAFATAQGGHDNITVAVTRVPGSLR